MGRRDDSHPGPGPGSSGSSEGAGEAVARRRPVSVPRRSGRSAPSGDPVAGIRALTTRGHRQSELLRGLPPIWPEPLREANRAAIAARGERLVVLDDDPTGTQTVQGVPVLIGWGEEDLARELAQSPVFYLLTNSRSLAAPATQWTSPTV